MARRLPTASAARRVPRSLFGEILDWMLAPLLLLWPMSVLLTWLVAQTIANKPFDRELGQIARALAGQVSTADVPDAAPHARFVPTPGTAALLEADGADRLHYQVRGFEGERLGGDAALPAPAEDDRPPGELRFRDDVIGGADVRVAWLWVPRMTRVATPAPPDAAADAPAPAALVQVAETRGKRARLATEIIKGVVLPQLVVLPLAVLLVWLALARGIAPLGEVQQRIRHRDDADLSPLDERGVPEEVAPLVRALNDLLARLERSIGTQKRFLADAAHQLKTPLAGLRMQAELAQREIDAGSTDAQQLKRSLRQIALASQRAAHMVNQLLSMARAEGKEHAARRQPVDLARLAAETVRDFVPRALDARLDLGYEGPPDDRPLAPVSAHPLLLREAVRNLVDNALQYTPAGGTVTVRARADAGGAALLEVEDSGPGIAPDERERVFQPFYRALGTAADGSGLGLAIVREIAQQHGATVTLGDAVTPPPPGGAHGPGALFTLRFPPSAGAAG